MTKTNVKQAKYIYQNVWNIKRFSEVASYALKLQNIPK